MFTQTFICFALSILLCFSYYGHAIRVDSGDKHSEHGITKSHKHRRNPMKLLESVSSVQNYGAKGDGKADDTKAFEAAWSAACAKEDGVMLIPAGYKFKLQPITFDGVNCQANITVQVDGEIVAPSKVSEWYDFDTQWIIFTGISKGLTIRGNGVVDGSGKHWWEHAQSIGDLFDNNDDDEGKRPHAMVIEDSNNVTVTGITFQNSPRMHLYFSKCQHVTIFNFTISSPGDSPNTDGIHLSETQHVDIYNSTLACGDDCISIQRGCSDVTITDVHCGPGHGFSIGSLGYGGDEAVVADIRVYNSTATKTSSGVRIKTWEGATGSVRNITFENITMSRVDNPIIIDQYYCNGHEFCEPKGKSGAVAITGVNFKNITGTYVKKPYMLVCSQSEPCKEINVAIIDLDPFEEVSKEEKKQKSPICSSAYGVVLTKTNPSFDDCFMTPDNVVAPATSV